jgi:hypothetical protein
MSAKIVSFPQPGSQSGLFSQVQHLEKSPLEFTVDCLTFGNNSRVELRRDGVTIILSGNRHLLATIFEQTATKLRGSTVGGSG